MSVNARDQRDAGPNSPTAQQLENLLKLAVEHCEANFQRGLPAPGKPVTVENSVMVNHAATMGHLRMDFGHKGGEFWSTWHPHNDNAFNTPSFSAELDEFMEELRTTGPPQAAGDERPLRTRAARN